MTVKKHILAAALGLGLVGAAPVAGQNLLINPSFENGLTGWTITQESALVASYGAAGVPGTLVGDYIAGGSKLLRDTQGSAVEQEIQLASFPPNTNLRVGGYFGGWTTENSARLVIRFKNAGGVELAQRNLDWVTPDACNKEHVLVRREQLLEIPPNTASVVTRIEFDYQPFSSTYFATADAIYVEAVQTPIIPPAHPLYTELLKNGDFESGWTASSPLTPNDPSGWEGLLSQEVVVNPYSNVDPDVPITDVSCEIGGGSDPHTSCIPGGAGSLLSGSDGPSAIRQIIDVRGNAPQIGTGDLWLHFSAYLGGVAGFKHHARVEIRLLDVNFAPTSETLSLGPVLEEHRNGETVVVRREDSASISTDTAYIEVRVDITDDCCHKNFGLVDNVSVMLGAPPPFNPIPLGKNLVKNHNFENGSIPGSPLQLNKADGWIGTSESGSKVVLYGDDEFVPSSQFAEKKGLEAHVLQDGSNSGLQQVIDARGSKDLIDAGRLRLFASAWLGGYNDQLDHAEVRVRFLGENEADVGPLQTLGPVTASDRDFKTILKKVTDDYEVPYGTRSIVANVVFSKDCFCSSRAMADKIELIAYDTLAKPIIKKETLTDGEVGIPYDVDLKFVGGTMPYSASIKQGFLPSGLSLSDEGILSGVPLAPEKSTFTVRLTDALGQEATEKLHLTIVKAVAWKTSSVSAAKHGSKYKQKLKTKGGSGSNQYTIVGGGLPDGILLDPAKGRLSGTPTEVGSFLVTIQVEDQFGATDTREFFVDVANTLKIKTKTLPAGKVDQAYAGSIVAKGGVGGYQFSLVTGAMPTGIIFTSSGKLTGKASAVETVDFTVRVTDASGIEVEKDLSLTVK